MNRLTTAFMISALAITAAGVSASQAQERRVHTEIDPVTHAISTEWLKDGKRDRADGPALIVRQGTGTVRVWYKGGKRDRADGPAVIISEGKRVVLTAWYKDGNRIEPPSAAAKPAPAPAPR